MLTNVDGRLYANSGAGADDDLTDVMSTKTRRFKKKAKGYGGVWLYSHPACEGHCIADHPEQPLRVAGIVSSVLGADLPRLTRHVVNAPPVSKKQLLAFHSQQHVDRLDRMFKTVEGSPRRGRKAGKHMKAKGGSPRRGRSGSGGSGGGGGGVELQIDHDTKVMRGTGEAARRAAGAACAAVDAVMKGEAASAFVAVRPPGHHAEPNRAMGFCFWANVGVAAFHARARHGIKRVAALDFDVHHGNGTLGWIRMDEWLD